MKHITLTILIVLSAFSFVSGQNVMPSDYKADQVLKSNARVNPTSLAMELSIPIGGYKGRAGNGVPIAFNYSSKVWQMETTMGGPFEFMSGVKTALQPTYAKRTAAGWSSTIGSPRIDFPPNVYEGSHDYIQYVGQLYQPVECTNNCSNENFYLYYVKRVQLTMPDGSSHEFRQDDTLHSYGTHNSHGTQDMTGTYLSVDGSRMRLDISSGGATLFLSDGGRYIWTSTPASSSMAVEFYDRHGNKMTFNVSTRIWTDTIGRTIEDPFPDNWASQNQIVDTVDSTFPGVGSETLNVSYEWVYLRHPSTSASVIDDPDNTSQTLSYSSNAYCSSGGTVAHYERSGSDWLFSNPDVSMIWVCSPQSTKFNPIVLKSIDLPNGQSYQFRYNAFGEITKVIYPTGGYERFKYAVVGSVQPNGVSSYDQANRGVIDRWISEKGDGSDEIHWTYDNDTWTITAPDGTRTEQSVYTEAPGSPQPYGFGDAKTGRPYEDRSYNSSNQLMSRKLTLYETTGPLSGGFAGATRDMRPVKEITILFEYGNSNALATMTETVYDTSGNSDAAYFSSLNPKQQKTNHYVSISASTATSASLTTAAGWFSGLTPASITEMDYLYDANYKARNINGLVSATRVLDPTNTSVIKAKSEITYDGVSLLDESESTRWVNPSTNYRGLVTKTRSWHDITGNLYIDTSAQYDLMGNLRYSWDGRNNLSEVQYLSDYDYAFPTKTITPVPDSNGTYGANTTLETTMTYDFDTALPLTVTDSNGAVTEMEYVDPLFRQTKTIAANDAETITEYGAGTSASTRWVKVKSQIDATNWKEALSWFDGLGRGVRSQSVDAESGDVFSLTCYDNMGRVSKATNPFRGYTTQDCSTTSGLEWTTNTYDTAGRPWKVTTPDGAEVETTYGLAATSSYLLGTVVTVEDQADKQRRSIKNALGQLKRVDEPTTSGMALGTLTAPNQATLYSYDTLGKMVRVQQGSQNRYFMHDAMGRMLRLSQPEQETNTSLNTSGNPDNNSWTAGFTYDNNGNVLTTTDAKNTTITSTYDRLNRAVSRTYSDGTPTVTNYYDGTGLSSVPDDSKGKLTKVSSSVSVSKYTSFDDAGRLLESKQETDGNTYTSGYQYNLAGALTQETYPSGRVVKNELDVSGDLAMVTSKKNSTAVFATYANSFSYSAAGAVTSMQLGNGRWENTSFNSRLQPVQLGLGASSTDAGVWKVNYEYGELQTNGTVDATKNSGNIGKQTLTIPGTSFVTAYKYDPLNRLTEAQEKTSSTQNWIQQFGYDVYGNRTSFSQTIGGTTTSTTPSVNATTNRFNGSQGFSYDKNGNVINDVDAATSHSRLFIFNGDNKQIEVKDVTNNNHVVGIYSYDGEGKRVKKVTDTETTIFVYSLGRIVAEYSTQLSSNPTVSYTTADHLGSPRIITDEIGQLKARRDFMPFGEEIYLGVGGRTGDSGQKYSASADDLRQRFTGYQKDSETSLDFAEARMYENRYGRFTAIDPLLASGKSANPQSFNRFTYCLGNPLAFVDKNGKWPTRTHDFLIDRAFGNLSSNQRALIKAGSLTVDTIGSYKPGSTFWPSEAHKHAMTQKGLSQEQAMEKSNAYLQGMLNDVTARQREHEEAGGKGISSTALILLGEATHVYEDMTSPAHGYDKIYGIPQKMVAKSGFFMAKVGSDTLFESEADWAMWGSDTLEHMDAESGNPTLQQIQDSVDYSRGFFYIAFGKEKFNELVSDEDERKRVTDLLDRLKLQYQK